MGHRSVELSTVVAAQAELSLRRLEKTLDIRAVRGVARGALGAQLTEVGA